MLDVDEIDLHYGAAQALRRVSLTARPGEVTCALGRNGVGKTSLMGTITGHHPISEGRIAWQGADISRLRPSDRARRGIALVPQGREIFPLLTVRENLETGFAPCRAPSGASPSRCSSSSPGSAGCFAGAAATCRAASSSSWRSPGRW